MKCYSEERKQSVLKKMMAPLNTPVSQLVTETGISDCTLYAWRKEASLKGAVVPGNTVVLQHGILDNRRFWQALPRYAARGINGKT